MAKVSTLYRPGYGPDDHDDENAFGVPPAGVVLGRDYSDASDDRGLDEWLSKQADRSPEMKAVTTPGAVQTDSPDDSADLDKYIDQVAPKDTGDAGYHPDQSHDDESWLQANASPRQPVAPQYGTEPDSVTKGAIIASGIGSFLQRKPFDAAFWGGREARKDRLAHQGIADAAQARIGALRDAELRQREESLRSHSADAAEQRTIQRARLGIEGDRTATMKTTADAKAADLERKGAFAAENANANGDRAHRMTEFYVRNGIPLRSVQGLSPDDMKQLSPELEKAFNLAEPQVRAEVGLAGRKAGAESDARFPNEARLAQIRADNAAALAAQRDNAKGGGLGDDLTPSQRRLIAAWERLHPGFHVSEPHFLLKAENDGKGRTKYVGDTQDTGLLHTATAKIQEERDAVFNASSFGEAAAHKRAMGVAIDKAAGALNRITGGGGTAEERAETIKKYPALMDPFADGSLEEIGKVFEEVGGSKMASYGVVPSPAGYVAGSAYTDQPADAGDQPITRSGLGDAIPTTDPQDRLTVTPRVGPKVNAVPGANMPPSAATISFVLPDGTRKKAPRANVAAILKLHPDWKVAQ